MTKDELVKLAERCEAASGPDRELDVAIFQAIGAPAPFQFANKLIALEFNDIENAYFARVSDDMRVRYSPPAYTASIDAAMTLVPEGWSISFGEKPGLPPERRMFAWLNDHNTPDGIAVRHTEASARTIELAICAAALRATPTGEAK